MYGTEVLKPLAFQVHMLSESLLFCMLSVWLIHVGFGGDEASSTGTKPKSGYYKFIKF